MTDIDTLPAGRELDALVAEKVMGWQEVKFDGPTTPHGIPPVEEWWNDPKYMDHGTGTGSCHVPHYSTSIAAAWEVVEKMTEKGYAILLVVSPIGTHADFANDVEDHGHECDAQTTPLAICRAALKAVGA